MKIDITYDNGLLNAAQKIERDFADIIGQCAQIVCDRAKEICPVDTGRLRDSITAESDGEKAYVSANTDYAAYVEFGTSKTAPHPYLVPALLDSAGAVARAAAAAAAEL